MFFYLSGFLLPECWIVTATDKVNRMAGVEDGTTHLDNCQARFVARLGDIVPVGFGDEGVIDHGLSGSARRARMMGSSPR